MELSIVVEGTMFGSPGSMPGKSQTKVLMVGYAMPEDGLKVSFTYGSHSLIEIFLKLVPSRPPNTSSPFTTH